MKPAEGSTVIGKSVNIRGELSGNEDLYMDGDIEGTITLTESRLTIGPNARIRAHVSARDIVVFGHLNGNVHATGRVDLRESALVTGDILAGRLSIEESATLKGRVELRASSTEAKPVPSSTPATSSTPVTTPEAPVSGTPLFPQPQA